MNGLKRHCEFCMEQILTDMEDQKCDPKCVFLRESICSRRCNRG